MSVTFFRIDQKATIPLAAGQTNAISRPLEFQLVADDVSD